MTVKSLSVFLPAYNEEKNIKNTIDQVDRVCKENNFQNYEILIINDGSLDKTADIVSAIAKKNKRVHLISHLVNKGYGGALITGFKSAKYEWVAFTDADGQFDFRQIDKFLEKTSISDLILGYRLNRADPMIRTVLTFGWKTLALLLLNLTVKDYSCGFKLIKKKVFDRVEPLVSGEKVTQIELLVKAKKQGFKFSEVGVNHYPRKFGKPTGASLKVFLKSLVDLFKLWWQLR